MGKMKSFVKYNAGKWLGAQDNKILKLMDRNEVISFDIFDTLVKRNVNEPGHVHKIVWEEFAKDTQTELHNYPGLRVQAEKEARKCSSGEEVTLEHIFRHLEGVPEAYREKLRKLEEKAEVEICCPCLRMKKLYKRAQKKNKHIIITSDMYLGEDVIKKILEKCGYDRYERLYLSSAYGLCKSTGNIYEVIKKDYPEFKGRILHIGDNLKSDFWMAKKKGMSACLIDGQQVHLKYWKKKRKDDLDYSRIFSFLNNHISDTYNEAETIGYEILGPMLLGYSMWLKEKIDEDSINKIFFLSREGRLLQDAFQALYPENNVEQCYLYVSRQSLVIPLMADVSGFDEMVDLLKIFLHTPLLKTIRIVCCLEQNEFCRELSEIGMDESTRIYEIPDDKKEAVFSIIYKLGKGQFEQQKIFVKRYLEQNGFSGNIAVADIGWAGTIQKALDRYATDSNTVIHGYYFGVRDLNEKKSYDEMYRCGYAFDIGKNQNFELMARFTTEILETLFLHRSGSVQSYNEENGKIVPTLSDEEYGEKDGTFIKSMQKAALKFLLKAGEELALRDSIKVQPEYVMKAYAQFAVYPKMSTIHAFEKFRFRDVSIKKLLPDHNIFYYFFHMNVLKNDLNSCLCKIFFLKKLFKVNLPYFDLLSFLVVKMNIRSDYRKRFYGEKT